MKAIIFFADPRPPAHDAPGAHQILPGARGAARHGPDNVAHGADDGAAPGAAAHHAAPCGPGDQENLHGAASHGGKFII